MLDGATGDGRPRRRALETIVAGAADGAAPVTVPAPGGGERFTWARHEAGWFEGAPLRLELVAAGPDGGRSPGRGPGAGRAGRRAADAGRLDAGRLDAGRAALWALADAVVVVAPGPTTVRPTSSRRSPAGPPDDRIRRRAPCSPRVHRWASSPAPRPSSSGACPHRW
ncbi:MAG: hypothetical protein R2755_29030 [Acidimicrobiales bacterium]